MTVGDRVRAPARGWRGRGRGYMTIVDTPPVWEGSSVQVAGLFPFSTGTTVPTRGAPLGMESQSGTLFCADPITYFKPLHLIHNPSFFVLGKPGLGKSTLVKRMALGMAAMGVLPMVLGDLKPDYVPLVKALGGQVIKIGPGYGAINLVSIRDAQAAADVLASHGHRQAAMEVLGDARSRRQMILSMVISIQRNGGLSDREEMILAAVCEVLDADPTIPDPTMRDVLAVLRDKHPSVRDAAIDRGDDARYLAIVEHLEATIQSLVAGGRIGSMFAGETTVPMRLDRAVVFDVSATEGGSEAMQGAVLMAVWNYGFAQVEIANVLAEHGLAPQRRFVLILDELWRALRVAEGMVDRVDKLTRLNRTIGVGTIMISHTMADLDALKTEEDRQKASGFVERSGAVMLGGLPAGEMPRLAKVITLSREEQRRLVSWTDPGSYDSSVQGDEVPPPPGQGKFLMKIGSGDRPGIPFEIILTPYEYAIMDTNARWADGH